MATWGKILALSVAGGGVNARYWWACGSTVWASSQFPWPTFTINVSGAFAIGFLTALLARWEFSATLPSSSHDSGRLSWAATRPSRPLRSRQ